MPPSALLRRWHGPHAAWSASTPWSSPAMTWSASVALPTQMPGVLIRHVYWSRSSTRRRRCGQSAGKRRRRLDPRQLPLPTTQLNSSLGHTSPPRCRRLNEEPETRKIRRRRHRRAGCRRWLAKSFEWLTTLARPRSEQQDATLAGLRNRATALLASIAIGASFRNYCRTLERRSRQGLDLPSLGSLDDTWSRVLHRGQCLGSALARTGMDVRTTTNAASCARGS